MADPLSKRIQFYEQYKKRQESVLGGLIDPTIFNILSGSGEVRLGEGWTGEERQRLSARLGDIRTRRQALKRQFEIAEKRGEYGQVGFGKQFNRASLTGSEVGAVSGTVAGTSAAVGASAGAAVGAGIAPVAGAPAGMAMGVGAGVGALGGALVALPLAAIAAAILGPIAASQASQAKKQRKKLRSIGAAQELLATSRGVTRSGALLSREGAMRIAKSKARHKTTT